MRVLLVENDVTAASDLGHCFTQAGLQFEAVDTGEEALELLRHYEFDVVVLNLHLPDMDGCTVIKRMRAARHDAPVLALCSGLNAGRRVAALSAGADDVVDRFVDKAELTARMRALVRRMRGYSDAVLRVGPLTLNVDQHTVSSNGADVALTGKEFALLQLLMMRRNMVMTKDAILAQLYGGLDEPEPKIIDVFVCKIRNKLAKVGVKDVISTVWGRGYTVRDTSDRRETSNSPQTPQPAWSGRQNFVAA